MATVRSINKKISPQCMPHDRARREGHSVPSGVFWPKRITKPNNEETSDKPKFDNDEVKVMKDEVDGGSAPN